MTEKPDDISFEDIYQAIWEPLEDQKKDRKTFLSEWKQSLADEGECFVALNGNEIVGTLSVTMRKRDCWYAKGMVPFCLYVRVAAEWQGHNICTGLMDMAVEYAKIHECDIVELRTGAANGHAIAVYRHLGYRAVKLLHPKHHGYSIRMAKFLEEEPNPVRLSLTDTSIRILLPFYRAARKVYHLFRRRK